MKAIILAAGYGTRLQPLTHHLPKPLLPVVGVPVLQHVITKLKACTVSGLGINAHYMPEAIREFIEREYAGNEIVLSEERHIMGSGGGIAGFRSFVAAEDYFVVHNGDILSDIDILPAREQCEREQPLCAMIVHDYPPANNVCVGADGRVVDIRGKLKSTAYRRTLAYAGVALMRPEIFRYIPEGPCDIIDVLLEVIASGRERVLAIAADGTAWSDIGSPRRYLDAHAAILLQRTPLVARKQMPSGPFRLGKECVVASDVLLSGFVSAGRGVRIMRGARLKNCILWDHAIIDEGRELSGAVVGPGWAVQVE